MLSELDIYSIVRANKPLQLVDVRVSVTKDGMITVSFEGVHGSPVINGICIRRAPPLAGIFPFLHCNFLNKHSLDEQGIISILCFLW